MLCILQIQFDNLCRTNHQTQPSILEEGEVEDDLPDDAGSNRHVYKHHVCTKGGYSLTSESILNGKVPRICKGGSRCRRGWWKGKSMDYCGLCYLTSKQQVHNIYAPGIWHNPQLISIKDRMVWCISSPIGQRQTGCYLSLPLSIMR
jgi:hypothetical protein